MRERRDAASASEDCVGNTTDDSRTTQNHRAPICTFESGIHAFAL
jgi:hypothetical protein